MLTRRSLLRASAMTMGLGAAPGWLARAAGQGTGSRKILVTIFQRGGADGLNMVVPYFERRYYALRPNIAIPPPGGSSRRPGQTPNGALDLDGRFGLHLSLQPLKPLWDSGQLSFVHAAGSPHPTRSHLDAQAYMESGTAGIRTEDGWLSRALPADATSSPLRAVAMGPQLPHLLRGSRGTMVIDDLLRFQTGDSQSARIVEKLYATAGDTQLMAEGTSAFEAARMLESVRRQPGRPASGSPYVGELGRRLQQVARLIKADVGVEIVAIDSTGWDHHTEETFLLTDRLRELGASLAAFVQDMGDRMEDIVIVTMSEFGRTAAQNMNFGTEHGHGNVMMVLGGPVRGGSVYGTWPGLEPEQLHERRDLAVTTDFRDVLGDVVRTHLGQDPAVVFLGHQGRPLGLMRT